MAQNTGPPAPRAVPGAGRTGENVITEAEDGFGTSVGRETIGIYSSSNVRGFSPSQAGNVRIEGLYFDQVWTLSPRVRRSTSIRVGLSAQGYPFPAPTGVVDHSFRTPGTQTALSAAAGTTTNGTIYFEGDISAPLAGENLAISMGLGLYGSEYQNGTSAGERILTVAARWSPSPSVNVVPFWSRSDLADNEIGPVYVPEGSYLPPRISRRRFNGPDWALYEGTAVNYGVFGRAEIAPGWQVRAAVFRSFVDARRDAFTALTGLRPDGTGRFAVIVEPPSKAASTSGELRLTHRLADGPRVHTIHVNLRARARDRGHGGGSAFDLGPSYVGETIDVPEPARLFSPQTNDRIRQLSAGISYEGRWPRVGELSLGLQHADYRKAVAQPGLPLAETRAAPWLFNAAAAAHLTDRLAVYAGYTRGLEESGAAPQTAANRGEAMAAILTSQRDIGIRYRLTERLRLIAGAFDIRKPYFSLDAENLYRQVGEVRNRGFEMSLSGRIAPRLDIVIGGVLLRPRVLGEEVRLGRIGPRPVGVARRSLDFNADWRIPRLEGLSVNLGISHVGAVPATRSNMVTLPPRTLVSIGARYRFRIDGHDAVLRLSVTNLFDEYAFELRSAGTYDVSAGRIASALLALDF